MNKRATERGSGTEELAGHFAVGLEPKRVGAKVQLVRPGHEPTLTANGGLLKILPVGEGGEHAAPFSQRRKVDLHGLGAVVQAQPAVLEQFAGNCKDVAQSLYNAFKEAGLNPSYVQATVPRAANIATQNPAYTAAVSQNGQHFAVQVGNRVYDAFTGMQGVVVNSQYTQYSQLFTSQYGAPVITNIGTKLP